MQLTQLVLFFNIVTTGEISKLRSHLAM